MTRRRRYTHIKGDKEIFAIGGKVLSTFLRLRGEVERMNDNSIIVFQRLSMKPDKDTYIRAAINGAEAVQDAFVKSEVEAWLAMWSAGDVEKVDRFRRLGYSEERLLRVLKMEARKKLADTLKMLAAEGSTAGRGIWHCPMTERYFSDALELDQEEGLKIDCAAFLKIYDRLSEARQMEAHERHLRAAEAMNLLFASHPITWDELQRYFIIEGGTLSINPASENKQAYMRIC